MGLGLRQRHARIIITVGLLCGMGLPIVYAATVDEAIPEGRVRLYRSIELAERFADSPELVRDFITEARGAKARTGLSSEEGKRIDQMLKGLETIERNPKLATEAEKRAAREGLFTQHYNEFYNVLDRTAGVEDSTLRDLSARVKDPTTKASPRMLEALTRSESMGAQQQELTDAVGKWVGKSGDPDVAKGVQEWANTGRRTPKEMSDLTNGYNTLANYKKGQQKGASDLTAKKMTSEEEAACNTLLEVVRDHSKPGEIPRDLETIEREAAAQDSPRVMGGAEVLGKAFSSSARQTLIELAHAQGIDLSAFVPKDWEGDWTQVKGTNAQLKEAITEALTRKGLSAENFFKEADKRTAESFIAKMAELVESGRLPRKAFETLFNPKNHCLISPLQEAYTVAAPANAVLKKLGLAALTTAATGLIVHSTVSGSTGADKKKSHDNKNNADR